VTTRRESKPGSKRRRATNVRTIRPAPTSSTRARASSEAINRRRNRCRPAPTVEPRSPSRREPVRSGGEAWTAGRGPKVRPVRRGGGDAEGEAGGGGEEARRRRHAPVYSRRLQARQVARADGDERTQGGRGQG